MNPDDAYEMTDEEAAELLRLLDLYRRSEYYGGDEMTVGDVRGDLEESLR